MSKRGNYPSDRAWSDLYLPWQRAYLSKRFGVDPVSNSVWDNCAAVDFRVGTHEIMGRMRSYECFEKYPFDLTFRFYRLSGAQTECSKVFEEGWGTHMLYGFASLDERSVAAYQFADLAAIRVAIKANPMLLHGPVPNKGGNTWFKYVTTTELPPGCIIDSSLDRNPQPGLPEGFELC